MKYLEPNFEEIKEEIRVLCDVDNPKNTEYVRGCLEIVSSFLKINGGLDHAERTMELARNIGFSEEFIKKLY